MRLTGKRAVALAIVVLLAVGLRIRGRRDPQAGFPQCSYNGEYFVEEVYDGDTIRCAGLGRVRLIGIDTPERDEAGFAEATEHTRQQALGKTVRLDICPLQPKDKYDRWRALVYVQGRDGSEVCLNRELVELGLARISDYQPCHVDATTWRVRPTAPPTPALSEAVYVAPHGQRYHKAGCPSLGASPIRMSKQEAEKKGYTPCRRCWPAPEQTR